MSRKTSLFCRCLHEIENHLPRTKRCFMACADQREILSEREKTKTPLMKIDKSIPTIEELKRIEKEELQELLVKPEIWKSVDINYHPPRVRRVWTDIGDKRIYLHVISPCTTEEALYHPHPWPSAIHIVSGCYEMGIAYGPEDKLVKQVCRTILNEGSYYEMLDPDGWHYVRPLEIDCHTLMITGKPWNRWSPKSEEKLESLDEKTKNEILRYFSQMIGPEIQIRKK